VSLLPQQWFSFTCSICHFPLLICSFLFLGCRILFATVLNPHLFRSILPIVRATFFPFLEALCYCYKCRSKPWDFDLTHKTLFFAYRESISLFWASSFFWTVLWEGAKRDSLCRCYVHKGRVWQGGGSVESWVQDKCCKHLSQSHY
jgi:hypothetical protein